MKNYLKMSFMGISENEATARTAAAAVFSELNPTIEQIADVRTAVSEAVTNAIVHGYRGTSGMVEMECSIIGDIFTVIVSDAGCGIENLELAMQPFYTTAKGEERTGIGFAVMQAFMDNLEVTSEIGKGTKVTMKKRVKAFDDVRELSAVRC